MEARNRSDRPRMTGETGPYLSIVAPVYLTEQFLDELVTQVRHYAREVTENFEVVLVDDGSPGGAWSQITRLGDADPRIKGVRLSRNFGQHSAITAGLQATRGRYVILMDADLQDDPKYIPELHSAIRHGHDIVYTRKRRRRHRFFRNVLGRLYTRVINLLVEPRLRDDPGIGNYSILTRQVVDAFLEMRDYHRAYLGLLRWMGFESTVIDIDHAERPSGKSAYTASRLVNEFVNGVASQSDRLLKLSIVGGFFMVAMALAGTVALIVLYFTVGFLQGWTSLAVLVIASTGTLLTSLGVASVYIGKTFDQVRDRPLYLVKSTLNLGDLATELEEEETAMGGKVSPILDAVT